MGESAKHVRMDLTPRSLAVYTALCGLFAIALLVWAVRSLLRGRDSAEPSHAGHFLWAQAEMEQIAAERNPQRQKYEAGLAAAKVRADLELEARRLIAELSEERRGALLVNPEEVLARGLGVTARYAILRQLSSALDHVDPPERPAGQGSRFVQLRRWMEAEDAPPRRALAARRGR